MTAPAPVETLFSFAKCAADRPGAVLLVGGPTASGKSGLALELASRLNGVVINADSMQIYRELTILTARPGPAALAAVPHRLYGVMPAREAGSVARWRALALAEIADAHHLGRLPVVVGGTGLYLRALLEGLSVIPAIPPEVRTAALARLEALGAPGLHAVLAARDPETAASLRPGDRQRLIRAWEVLEATGRPLADWHRQGNDGPSPGLTFAAIVTDPPREALYAACEGRLRAMVAAGALEEVRALIALGLAADRPAMKALGVAELAQHLAGTLTLEAALELAQRSTRHYAKRQVTWFRHQLINRPDRPPLRVVGVSGVG